MVVVIPVERAAEMEAEKAVRIPAKVAGEMATGTALEMLVQQRWL